MPDWSTIDQESGIILPSSLYDAGIFRANTESLVPESGDRYYETCVTYLSFETFDSGVCGTDNEFEWRGYESYKLYHYAAHHWGHHALNSIAPCPAIIGFLQCKSKAEASMQALMAKELWPSRLGLQPKSPAANQRAALRAYFGLGDVVKTLLYKQS